MKAKIKPILWITVFLLAGLWGLGVKPARHPRRPASKALPYPPARRRSLTGLPTLKP